MFSFLFELIDLVLKLYKLVLLAHFIIGLMKIPGNKWTNLIARSSPVTNRPGTGISNRSARSAFWRKRSASWADVSFTAPIAPP